MEVHPLLLSAPLRIWGGSVTSSRSPGGKGYQGSSLTTGCSGRRGELVVL